MRWCPCGSTSRLVRAKNPSPQTWLYSMKHSTKSFRFRPYRTRFADVIKLNITDHSVETMVSFKEFAIPKLFALTRNDLGAFDDLFRVGEANTGCLGHGESAVVDAQRRAEPVAVL